MENFEKLGVFYLGKKFDIENDKLTDELSLYDSKDLTTHAVCVGMTGSGKTGLCLSLLEEAIIDNVPIIAIDPKGDISNLLLNFDKLDKESFLPWVSKSEAEQKGMDLETFAETTAKAWKEGIESWGQTEDRLKIMKANADFKIYTPGSNDGLEVSLLEAFTAPTQEIIQDLAALNDKIESTVSSLLNFVGQKENEVGSPTHTFVSQIFLQAWSISQSLSLPDLILQIQNPSFDKIGVMNLDSFFDSSKRTKLALAINSFLASPNYKMWSQGKSLSQMGQFLYGEKGRPQVSIFSIAHLAENERMFFVSKLLNELVSWVRKQPGTSSLRAILYMDEIYGYFPPNGNPPSKKPMLTLLKQSRAQGLGVVLATQNPVDLDYKGLSNTGTWFIGRLQTQNDKDRLIEGLKTTGSEGVDWDKMISSLKKRVFLVHNVHEKQPTVIQTRWALSYLRGPLTGAHISKLMSPFKNLKTKASQDQKINLEKSNSLPPVLPKGIAAKYLENSEGRLRPHCGSIFSIHYTDTKNKLDAWKDCQIYFPFGESAFNESSVNILKEEEKIVDNLKGENSFAELPGQALDLKFYKAIESDLKDYIYKNLELNLWTVPNEKICSMPGETEDEFRGRLKLLLKEKRDEAVSSIQKKYERKIQMIEKRIFSSESKISKEKDQLSQQKTNAVADIGFSVLSALMGGRGGIIGKAKTAQRGVGRISREKEDLARAEDELKMHTDDLNEIKMELEEQILDIENQFDPEIIKLETINIAPKKADLKNQWTGILWTN